MDSSRNVTWPLLFLMVSLASSVAVAREDAEPHSMAKPAGLPASTVEALESSKGISGGVETFLRIAGSNFFPRDSTAVYSYFGGGCLQRDANVGDAWFTADLQLPNGSVIDYLRVYYYDNDATFDVTSELLAFDGSGGSTLIAEADSSGSPGYSSAGSGFFSHTVDNLNQSLVVVAAPQGGVGSTLALCGIRIRYQAPLPTVIFRDGFES